MSGDPPATLQSLTSFTVTVRYRLRETMLDVWQPGVPQPVARLHAEGPTRARTAYHVLVGPQLDQPAGLVTPAGAVHPDGTTIGIVNLTRGRVVDADINPMSVRHIATGEYNPALWRMVQAGLPPLVGRAANRATRLCYNRLTHFFSHTLAVLPTPAAVATLAFQFRAPGSDGYGDTTRPPRAVRRRRRRSAPRPEAGFRVPDRDGRPHRLDPAQRFCRHCRPDLVSRAPCKQIT